MRVASVPEPTLRRLPSYYHYLLRLREKGQEMTSAAQIGAALGVHHTQVRKDLAVTGSQGRPKVGHRVDDLIASIEEFLNWNNVSDAFLVGVGHLGTALLGYAGFERAGVKIVAAFDASPRRAGKKIQGVSVLPVQKFPDLARRMHIAIGILTVPAEDAQEVAEMMVASGIQAIWNFAPIVLDLPETVIVENVALDSSLGVLSHKLAVHRKAASSPETNSAGP
ncbi:MAG: redox-sensing transcriptional repressor Rex [Thermoanaerobaculia bacterium]